MQVQHSLSKVMYKKIITTNIAPKKKEERKRTAHADTHFSPLGNSNDPPLLLDPCWVNHTNSTHYHHIITTTTEKNPYKASERRRDKRRYTVTKWHTGARERHRVEDPAKKHFHFSLLKRTHSLYTWETTKSSCRRIRWLLTDMMTKTQHTHGDRHTPSTDRVHRIGSWQLGFAFGVVMGIKYKVKAPYSWSRFVCFQTVRDNQVLIPPITQ